MLFSLLLWSKEISDDEEDIGDDATTVELVISGDYDCSVTSESIDHSGTNMSKYGSFIEKIVVII